MNAFTFSLNISVLLGPAFELRPLGHDNPQRFEVAAAVAQAPDGKALYGKNCKQCHGVVGNPPKAALKQYKNIATFTDPVYFTKHTHQEFIDAVTNGKGDMLASKGKLTTAEIEAVVTYIHTLAK